MPFSKDPGSGYFYADLSRIGRCLVSACPSQTEAARRAEPTTRRGHEASWAKRSRA
jgi:hypothetical protein